MRGTRGHQRLAAGAIVLLAASGLGPSLDTAGAAKHKPKKKPKPPSLSVSTPASVKRGAHYFNTMSGYSGNFNDLAYYLSLNPCAKTTAAEDAKLIGRHIGLKTKHKFSVKQGYTAGDPGKRYFCVYLYDVANPASKKQLRKSASYKVVV